MSPIAVTEPSHAHSKTTFTSGTLKKEDTDNQTHGAMGRTKDGRALKVRTYPKFDSLEEERLYRKQHLAAAYRVFAERGFDEGVVGINVPPQPKKRTFSNLTDNLCCRQATYPCGTQS